MIIFCSLSQARETAMQLNKLALKWLELKGIYIKTTDNFNTKASLVPGSIVDKKAKKIIDQGEKNHRVKQAKQ